MASRCGPSLLLSDKTQGREQAQTQPWRVDVLRPADANPTVSPTSTSTSIFHCGQLLLCSHYLNVVARFTVPATSHTHHNPYLIFGPPRRLRQVQKIVMRMGQAQQALPLSQLGHSSARLSLRRTEASWPSTTSTSRWRRHSSSSRVCRCPATFFAEPDLRVPWMTEADDTRALV